MKINKKAFTLAEVLVTLAIIGVVAALTIPTLIKNNQKQNWIAQYKKAYNTINQATMLIKADNDNTLTGTWAFGQENIMSAKYAEKIKVIKTCNGGAALGNCLATTYTTMAGAFGGTPAYDSGYGFITADGMGYLFEAYAGNGVIWVDTNGKDKGPNARGKDLHYFYVQSSPPVKAEGYAVGEALINSMCPTNLNGVGTYCGVRIIRGDYGTAY